jgi:hypothetical protein
LCLLIWSLYQKFCIWSVVGQACQIDTTRSWTHSSPVPLNHLVIYSKLFSRSVMSLGMCLLHLITNLSLAKLVRSNQSKWPHKTQSKRNLVGMQPCNKPCNVCKYVTNTKTFISNHSKQTFNLNCLFLLEREEYWIRMLETKTKQAGAIVINIYGRFYRLF